MKAFTEYLNATLTDIYALVLSGNASLAFKETLIVLDLQIKIIEFC